MGMTIDVKDPKAFAEWCKFIGAIPKAEYENRLKADMVAMLTEIQLEIEGLCIDNLLSEDEEDMNRGIEKAYDVIQQKINSLKAEIKPQGSEDKE